MASLRVGDGGGRWREVRRRRAWLILAAFLCLLLHAVAGAPCWQESGCPACLAIASADFDAVVLSCDPVLIRTIGYAAEESPVEALFTFASAARAPPPTSIEAAV